MALFGNLVVRLGLDKRNFDRNVSATRSVLGGLAKGASLAAGAITAFGTAIATAAVAGMTAMVKNSFEQIDAMAKLSDRLGVGTEALGGLGHAANLAGVEMEQLGTALQFMLKNISKGAGGDKGLAKTFESLGLSAKALAGQSTTNQFLAIAAAFEKIKNPAERMRLALEVFGRGGGPILNVLGEGSANLAAMVADAERLGLTFSRMDAAKIEAANDAWTRMHGALTGIANEIAIAIAPAVTSLINTITQGIGSAVGSVTSLQSAFQDVALAIFDTNAGLEMLTFGAALSKSGLSDKMKDLARAGFQTAMQLRRKDFIEGMNVAPGAPALAGGGATAAIGGGGGRPAIGAAGAGGVLGGLVQAVKRAVEIGVPGGALRGSQEALNRIVKARSGIENQALAEEKKQTAKLDKIEKHLGGGLGGLVLGIGLE